MRPDRIEEHRLLMAATALLAVALSGCSLFGSGSDQSEAEVTRLEKCRFDLKQAARVSGRDDADVVENVTITPDCDVSIRFRQTTGDDVGEIEDEGGEQVLGTGVVRHEDSPVPDS